MAKGKKNSISSEAKIKDAAAKVFMRKGFEATRTRDIAKEADINAALLNYYFRSKQKLFELVMYEKLQTLFSNIIPIVNDSSTPLKKKIELLVDNYTEVLSQNPDLPFFVLNELHKKNFDVVPDLAIAKKIKLSSFYTQLKAKNDKVDAIHFLLTLLGMTIFPFVSKPMILVTGLATKQAYSDLMQERKKLIPIWMEAILKSK